MTRAELKKLARYVRHLANDLELRDWEFRLEAGATTDEEACAEVEPVEGRKYATIKLSPDWQTYTPEQQRHYVVHELIHCHMPSASDIVRLDAAQQMSQAAYDVMWGGFVRQVEHAVDGMASAVDHRLPLP